MLIDLKVISIPGFSEPFSSMSHLLMAPLFILLLILLIRKARKGTHKFWHLFYGFAAIFLFSMSGVFHLLEPGGLARDVFQRLDHAAIFLMICGTMTPIHGILFTGIARWGVLGVMWGSTATGITLKSIYFEAIPESVGLTFYLVLGWLGLISGIMIVRRYGWGYVKFMAAGAICYTAGAIFDFCRWPLVLEGVIEPHEVFHVFVVLGALFHWRFIYAFADHQLSKNKVEPVA